MGPQGTNHSVGSVCEQDTFYAGNARSLKQDPLLCNLLLGSMRPLPSVSIFNIP